MEKNPSGIFKNFRSTFIVFVFCCWSTNVLAQNFDINTLQSINTGRIKSLDGTYKGLSNSVYPIAAIMPITELTLGYMKHDKKLVDGGWQTVAGLGVNFLATFSIKYAVNRTRPYDTYNFLDPQSHEPDPSFPSGHTSFSFCTATSVFFMYPKWYVGVAAFSWAAAVGYSRMALGVHYPTDVLTGAIVGTGSAYLTYKANQWIRKRKAHLK